MRTTNWKDVVELIGIVAIVAGLFFVALNAMQLAWILRERRIRMMRSRDENSVARLIPGWSRAT